MIGRIYVRENSSKRVKFCDENFFSEGRNSKHFVFIRLNDSVMFEITSTLFVQSQFLMVYVIFVISV